MSRKKKSGFSILSLALAATLVVTGCSSSSTGDSNNSGNNSSGGSGGEIVVSSFGGTYDEVFTKYVIEPFEAANPGVTVKLAPYTGVAKLAQGGGSTIDVVSLDDFDLIEAANQGLLSPLKPEEFPSWDNLYPQALLQNAEGETYGLANVFGAWGIAYNPEKVDKPESWNDLWKPEVKGKVAMMSQWIPDILLTAEATNASIDDMEPVWQAFKEITPSIAQYYNSFSAPESLFGTGEVIIASWFDGRALAMKQSGQPIEFVIPKEGGVLIRSVMGVTKDSKNQELARKLIEFSMSEEAQIGFAKELYYGPTNSTVTLDGEIKEQVVYGKEEVEALIAPDWNEILPKREEWLTKWTEVTSQ